MPFVDAEIARERQFVNFGNLFLRSPSFRTLFFFFLLFIPLNIDSLWGYDGKHHHTTALLAKTH